MKRNFSSALAAGLVAVATAGISPAHAATAFVNFDPDQGIAQGPSIFVGVPAMQTITTPQATFSGGVVLGLATFFPAIAFASSPNVYGTADFGNGLSRTLSIDINPSFLTTEVSFALFNGETFPASYAIKAFNGNTEVAAQTLTNIASNFNSGYGLVDLQATNITKVTIDMVNNAGTWDFLIDDIGFNQNVATTILPTTPPVFPVPAPIVIDYSLVDPSVVVIDEQGQTRNRKRKGKDQVDLVEVQIDFGDNSQNIKGNLLVLNDAVTQPIPEPSTWAMMLAGLGGLGVAAKRRGKATAAAIA